jgi:hypothetical protein
VYLAASLPLSSGCLHYVSGIASPPSGRPPEAGHRDGDQALTAAPSMSAAAWDSFGTTRWPPPLGYLPRPAGVFHRPRFFLRVGDGAMSRHGMVAERSATAEGPSTRDDHRRSATLSRHTTRDARLRGAGTLHPGNARRALRRAFSASARGRHRHLILTRRFGGWGAASPRKALDDYRAGRGWFTSPAPRRLCKVLTLMLK